MLVISNITIFLISSHFYVCCGGVIDRIVSRLVKLMDVLNLFFM
jgi:hypothetical protein